MNLKVKQLRGISLSIALVSLGLLVGSANASQTTDEGVTSSDIISDGYLRVYGMGLKSVILTLTLKMKVTVVLVYNLRMIFQTLYLNMVLITLKVQLF